ncbi:MAG: ApbE family lipoprotein [Chloroflexi bacterium]|nr:ApbE family lipoprotein [Chloroflexota bacterium]
MARRRFHAMGTTVSVLLPVSQVAAPTKAVEELFATWEERLSRFQLESELSDLNRRAGEPVTVGPVLFDVVSAALDAAQVTEGRFDPTMQQQMVTLGYNQSFEKLRIVAPIAGQEPRPAGDWRRVRLDDTRRVITLPQGVGIDLGGIAKGMAVDAALARLKAMDVHAALVNAGGDLAVWGLPPGMDAWPIAIQGKDTWYTIPLSAGAMATSGISRRRWQQGTVTRHHLLDPSTGLPVDNELWSVTAVAGFCGQAEVAAKAAFMLGPAEGQRFIEGRGLSGLLVREDGSWEAAGRWPVAMAVRT